MEESHKAIEAEKDINQKIKAKFMLIKSQKKEIISPNLSKKVNVFKTTKENPIKKPFKCFQIVKQTPIEAETPDLFNENIDYYTEYWKMYNDNEKTIEQIKESVYELYKMREYLKFLQNESNEENNIQNNSMDIDKEDNK